MPVKKTENVNKEDNQSKLVRSETDRIIAGVAGGIAKYFNVDTTLVRLIFVLITVFGGSGILIYIVLWIIIPRESYAGLSTDESIKANVDEMRERAHKFAEDARSHRRTNSRPLIGAILLFLGVLFLLSNFGYFAFFSLSRLWPIFLVLLGLAILMRGRRQ